MNSTTERDLVAGLAREHGISADAVKVVLEALRRGGGTMAQFSHAEPPRVCRRPFRLSHAAMAGSSSMA